MPALVLHLYSVCLSHGSSETLLEREIRTKVIVLGYMYTTTDK
jgi:hypothetical protein